MFSKKNYIFIIVFFMLFYFFADESFSNQIKNSGRYVEDEILVKFKSEVSHAYQTKLHASNNIEVREKNISSQENLVRLNIPDDITVEEAIKIYRDDPGVEYVEPNYIYSVCKTPNDSFYDELWGLNNTGQEVPEDGGVTGTEDADIDIPKAWNLNTGSSDVVVAVIDTGAKLTHEDLEDNLWINTGEVEDNSIDDDGNRYVDDYYGYDFVDDDKEPDDEKDMSETKDGHGSHVAGIIGAVGNNNVGVAGVNWDVSLMILRAFDTDGTGTALDIASAINYASDMGADIVNCSFAGSGSVSIESAIEDVSDVLFVCAAGNDGDGAESSGWDIDTIGQEQYPASYSFDNIISVASTDQDDTLTDYSNYGTTSVDVAAPGGDDTTTNVLSTFHNYQASYAYWSGTSMSTPYVSGLAALLLSRNSSLSVSDLKSKIINGVDVLDSLVGKIKSGGRINAYSSLSSSGSSSDNDDDDGLTGHKVCFIATAVYKSSNAWQVKKLCDFRDKYLITNKIGRMFVHIYYKIGPSMANFIDKYPFLVKKVRKVLDDFVCFYLKFENSNRM